MVVEQVPAAKPRSYPTAASPQKQTIVVLKRRKNWRAACPPPHGFIPAVEMVYV